MNAINTHVFRANTSFGVVNEAFTKEVEAIRGSGSEQVP